MVSLPASSAGGCATTRGSKSSSEGRPRHARAVEGHVHALRAARVSWRLPERSRLRLLVHVLARPVARARRAEETGDGEARPFGTRTRAPCLRRKGAGRLGLARAARELSATAAVAAIPATRGRRRGRGLVPRLLHGRPERAAAGRRAGAARLRRGVRV